jgi:hypothetical protein
MPHYMYLSRNLPSRGVLAYTTRTAATTGSATSLFTPSGRMPYYMSLSRNMSSRGVR